MMLKCGSAKSFFMAAFLTSGATSEETKRLKSASGVSAATSSMVGAGRSGGGVFCASGSA